MHYVEDNRALTQEGRIRKMQGEIDDKTPTSVL
jgi:hypothetical protein